MCAVSYKKKYVYSFKRSDDYAEAEVVHVTLIMLQNYE